jgi:hypothetical protein
LGLRPNLVPSHGAAAAYIGSLQDQIALELGASQRRLRFAFRSSTTLGEAAKLAP